MSNSKNTMVEYRRKRTGYTNYNLRLGLLKSVNPRMVVRKTSNYLTLQLVEYFPTGDKVLVTVNSKVLRKHGWKYSCKNIPSAYLAGLLFGKLAKEKSKSAIVDIGNAVSKRESALYAAVKGAIDSGLNVPVSEKVLPSEERLHGKHISEFASKNKDKTMFSGYVKSKALPEAMSEDVEKVKSKIMK